MEEKHIEELVDAYFAPRAGYKELKYGQRERWLKIVRAAFVTGQKEPGLSETARRAGMCVGTVRYVFDALGIKYRARHYGALREGRLDERLRRDYADHSTQELARAYGVSTTTILLHAKRLGLKHSEETMRRVEAMRVKKIGSPETRARMRASALNFIQAERRRMRFGLQQQSRRVFNTDPEQAKRRHTVRTSIRKRGYMVGYGQTEITAPEGLERSLFSEANAAKAGMSICAIYTPDYDAMGAALAEELARKAEHVRHKIETQARGGNAVKFFWMAKHYTTEPVLRVVVGIDRTPDGRLWASVYEAKVLPVHKKDTAHYQLPDDYKERLERAIEKQYKRINHNTGTNESK